MTLLVSNHKPKRDNRLGFLLSSKCNPVLQTVVPVYHNKMAIRLKPVEYCIAPEYLDPEMLLDPFEKHFNLPTSFTQLSNTQSESSKFLVRNRMILPFSGSLYLILCNAAGYLWKLVADFNTTTWFGRIPSDESFLREYLRFGCAFFLTLVTKNALLFDILNSRS